jgi:hypothetical protein
MDNVNVIYCDLPPKVKGMVVKTFDEEECYTIVLNSRLSAEQNRETYEHEMKHLKEKDFAKEGLDVGEIEWQRHFG